MDIDRFLSAILAMPQADQLTFGLLLLAVLAAVSLVLFRERRYFQQRQLAASWLMLRLLGLVLLLPLTVAVILGPARAISGMEALAYFYGALFTVGPLIWFGGHMLFGRLLRPSLSQEQTLFLAASGLLIVCIPATTLIFAEEPLRFALQRGEVRNDQQVSHNQLAHIAQAPRRFSLPGVGVVYTQTLSAGDGMRLEHVEAITGDKWGTKADNPLPTFCRHEDDVHLMWSAGEPTPRLRLHWRQADGKRRQGIFSPDTAALNVAANEDFAVSFRDNGFDPPAPIPRRRAEAGRLGALKDLYFSHLNQLQPGENPGNDCLMRGYKRFEWQQEGPIRALAIRFPGPSGQLRAELRASAEPFRP
jgi:hypothetical protein